MLEPATAWGISAGRLPSPLLALAVTDDDERVVGACEAETAVWAAAYGGLLARLPGALALEPVVHPSGAIGVSLAAGGVGLLWLDGRGSAVELQGGEQASAPLSASPDGRWLAAAAGAEVRIWELASGRLATRLPPTGPARAAVAGLGWMPGPFLLVARRRGPDGGASAIERWSLAGAPREERLPNAELSDDVLMAASPDGERFVVAARQGADLLLFDAAGRLVAPIRSDDEGPACAARFSPDGRRLALAKPTSLSLWRAADGAALGLVGKLPRRRRSALGFLHHRAALLIDDVDGYQLVDVEAGRWARAAAGPDAFGRDAEALAEGLALAETHEADYRTAATGAAERQADGAWCFEAREGGITLRARVMDGEAGAIHLVLRAHAGGTLGDWADEHHVYAADVRWAQQLLDLAPGAAFSVRRGFRRLALDIGLDCAPSADTVRGWLGALGARCRALG